MDGDGVGYRTLPGTDHPAAAYFTRGSGHNEKAQYTERPDDYVQQHGPAGAQVREHRARTCRGPRSIQNANASIGLICYGTSRYAAEESRDQLRREFGLETSYLRLKALPVHAASCADFIERHERVYVVEQNRDAQMLSLMRMELDPDKIAKLRSVRYYGGLPLDARTVTDEIVRQEGL